MACPAPMINFFNPVSLIGLGFIGYSVYSILTGETFVNKRNKYFIRTYQKIYFSEQPVLFSVNVLMNFLFGLILFDLINNIGILSALNQFKSFIFGH